MAQINVIWKMPSNIPTSWLLVSSVKGKIGSKTFVTVKFTTLLTSLYIFYIPLNNIKSGNKMTVHFCSYDQSITGNFLSEFAKQH